MLALVVVIVVVVVTGAAVCELKEVCDLPPLPERILPLPPPLEL